ncbi:type I-E CRISPR-associated protein Cas5/CasD [Streptomyces sp. NPDC006733]|uniref:type I-E CRISPR-associated protein Cas5/CasD n=1 Tax=Streptomyces sp. NPDC006733 TaxID=3155460 RepID=UPI0033DC439D
MSRGLVLRMAGLIQAWGENATFPHRDTAPHPTRSALIGMFAAAQGRTREDALTPYDDLPGAPAHQDMVFTFRLDRPGTLYRDFHTAGGGRPHKQGLRTAAGEYRAQSKSTQVTYRDYLTDAVFTVAVQGPPPLLAHIAATLTEPVFSPYLGRRACLPDEPLLIHTDTPDPVTALRERVPLTLASAPTAEHVQVTFLHEHPQTPGDLPERESPSQPADFTNTSRTHLLRPLWRTTEHLSAALYAGPRPIETLTDYILQGTPCPRS